MGGALLLASSVANLGSAERGYGEYRWVELWAGVVC